MTEGEKPDDEIDLGELLAALFAQKLLIGVFSVAALALSAVYAFQIAETEYSAETVFAMEEPSGPALPSGAEGLAALAGIELGGASQDLLLERLQGRDFILASAEELDLYDDPVFNPALTPPSLRSRIATRFLGGGLAPVTEAGIDNKIVARFRERATTDETENGGIALSVMHPDPDRAAEIANITVVLLFEAVEADELERARRTLSYFSDQLLEVQSDLDAALAAAQDFAVTSNIASAEELARTSTQLVNLRENRSIALDQLVVLDELAAIMSGDPGTRIDEIRRLQRQMPVAESDEFLRILGPAALSGNWSEVSKEVITEARDMITERLARIERSIEALQRDAEISAEQAAERALLERNVKIEQATYELLLEQFRRTSFASGYEDVIGEVYSRAAPPIEPSQPRRTLILALGLVLGVVSGSGIALARTSVSGRLYTLQAIRETLSGPTSLINGQFLTRLRGRNWSQLSKRARALDDVDAAELCFSLHQKNVRGILVTALDTPRPGPGLAALLADRLSGGGGRTLIFDVSGELRTSGKGSPTELVGVSKHVLADGQDLFRIDPRSGDPGRLFMSRAFLESLPAAVAEYDLVIYVLPALRQGKYFVEALTNAAEALIVVGRLGLARRADLQRLSGIARDASLHTYLLTQKR